MGGRTVSKHEWTIPGEVIEDVFQRLPYDWELTIRIEGGSVRPYLQITTEDGMGVWDGDGPEDGESLIDCISRLIRTVPEVGQ